MTDSAPVTILSLLEEGRTDDRHVIARLHAELDVAKQEATAFKRQLDADNRGFQARLTVVKNDAQREINAAEQKASALRRQVNAAEEETRGCVRQVAAYFKRQNSVRKRTVDTRELWSTKRLRRTFADVIESEE
jgi:hypothetical protein